MLADAFASVEQQEEYLYAAELYRLKGELTLQSQASLGQVKTGQDKSEDADPRSLTPDPQGEAEACFQQALEIARRQQRQIVGATRRREPGADVAGTEQSERSA